MSRDSDSLGDLSMKPTRDELVQRQSSRARPGKGSSSTPPPKRPDSGRNSGSQGFLWLMLLVVIGASAGGGWYLWQEVQALNGQLNQSSQALTTSEQALTSLQSNLENRDNTLSKSGDQMLEDIKLLHSEVRKLWDLSNKRNKADIASQAKAIEQLKGELKAANGQIASANSQVTAAKKDTAAANQKLEETRKLLQDLKASQTELNSALATQKKELSALKGRLNDSGDYDDRITSLEVAIKSIDAYRSQTNSRLDRMDRELGAMASGSGGG